MSLIYKEKGKIVKHSQPLNSIGKYQRNLPHYQMPVLFFLWSFTFTHQHGIFPNLMKFTSYCSTIAVLPRFMLIPFHKTTYIWCFYCFRVYTCVCVYLSHHVYYCKIAFSEALRSFAYNMASCAVLLYTFFFRICYSSWCYYIPAVLVGSCDTHVFEFGFSI